MLLLICLVGLTSSFQLILYNNRYSLCPRVAVKSYYVVIKVRTNITFLNYVLHFIIARITLRLARTRFMTPFEILLKQFHTFVKICLALWNLIC